MIGGGPTGYMLKSLEPERKDLNSLAWSLGIATAARADRLGAAGPGRGHHGAAARCSGSGTRRGGSARASWTPGCGCPGTDELAELSRTFNHTAEALEKQVEDMSAREAASRRFVADMSHELRTPLTAITAVTEVLEDEADASTR